MTRTWILPLLLSSVLAHAGQVYKWVDEKGRVHYGDKPEAAAKKLDVKPSSGPAKEPAEAGASTGNKPQSAGECEQKRTQLAAYENAPSVIEKNVFGVEREFTDAEKQKLIEMTRKQIQELCGGQPSEQ